MPRKIRSKNTHRSSPFEKPSKTIEGDLHVLKVDEIDDQELKSLLSRLGELNRSEQRRLMVRYRKYNERKNGTKTGQTKAGQTKTGRSPAIRRIGRRFPKIQNLIQNDDHSDKISQPEEAEEAVVITTRRATRTKRANKSRSSGNSTAVQSVRRSARLQHISAPMDVGDAQKPKYGSEVVYGGNDTSNPPIHQDPFAQDSGSEFDPEYDPYAPDEPDLEGFVIGDNDAEDLGSEDSYSSSGDYDRNEPEIGINEELNDLFDDVPMVSSRKRKREIDGMRGEDRDKFHSTLREIRENYNARKVDIAKVIDSDFGDEDNSWFYSRLGRIKNMEGKERYELEDEIQRKFGTLTSLKASGLYDKFNRPAERNIIKEILDSTKPDAMKQIMINRMMSVNNDGGEEYQKALAWLDVVMSIPTGCRNMIGSDPDTPAGAGFGSMLYRLKQNLDSNLFGMENVKRQIMQAVTTIQNDPESQGYIIALVGDPGVGKTTISSQIAETIGMGFGQVPCGSISDRSVVIGHSSTYIGSYPGIFTQLLIRTGQLNNVVLLDELDKLPDKSLLPTLLQILDREQNFRFKDAFCPEIDIDMSKNLYIIAVNDINCFDKALRDRMKVIYVDGYDTDQKTQICYNHIIPKIQAKTGITPNIDYDTIRYFVNKVSPQISGVRDITRYFEDIYEKLQLIHRFTEYLKHDAGAWGVALESVEDDGRPPKRTKRARNSRNSKNSRNNRGCSQTNDDEEDPIVVKFREVLKTHLNFDIPSNIDLRDVNIIQNLSVKLIESLEG
jgi:flagellar biosynthesis GTPase FlhF